MIGAYPIDGWTPLHFMLGFWAALTSSLGASRRWSFLIGVATCLIWEILDMTLGNTRIGTWFFDARGADIIDVLVGTVGAGVAVLVIKEGN